MAKPEVRPEWFEELPCSVTVCDRNCKILYMNERAAEGTRKEGGKALIGKSLMDCHPPEAQKKLREVMASRTPNVYTSERKGVKKMVYQAQWKRGGRTGGLAEIYFELPRKVANHIRD
jgi:hypothetical protein